MCQKTLPCTSPFKFQPLNLNLLFDIFTLGKRLTVCSIYVPHNLIYFEHVSPQSLTRQRKQSPKLVHHLLVANSLQSRPHPVNLFCTLYILPIHTFYILPIQTHYILPIRTLSILPVMRQPELHTELAIDGTAGHCSAHHDCASLS